MTVFPPAKINIGLFITEKRSDGFHNIETVFYPVPLTDTLSIEACDTSRKVTLDCDGIALPEADPEKNLCVKAYMLLDNVYDLPPVKMRLHKNIPSEAGLGGGSSDAAFTLKALNDLFDLMLDDDDLAGYASLLGSDCVFFIYNIPAFGKGRGDILEKVPPALSGYHIVLVKPEISISTAEAYSSVTARKPKYHLPGLIKFPVKKWRKTITNDFEPFVFDKFPEIEKIKNRLYETGAEYASMSGSGSCVYGLYRQLSGDIGHLFPGCFVWTGILC
jgi:4-diphosphocytidyl-2-C-methyl-D-erythritol kinase